MMSKTLEQAVSGVVARFKGYIIGTHPETDRRFKKELRAELEGIGDDGPALHVDCIVSRNTDDEGKVDVEWIP